MSKKIPPSFIADIDSLDAIQVSVVPGSGKILYDGRKTDGSFRIFLRASPEHGKANEELLAFLHRETGSSWEIVTGQTSRKKLCRRKQS